VDKKPLSNRLELLLPSFSGLSTKHQLCTETPCSRDVPFLLGLEVNKRVVVLKTGAKAFGFKSGPEGKLLDAGVVLGPVVHVLGNNGEVLAERLDRCRVLEEEGLISAVKKCNISVSKAEWGRAATGVLTVP
jgi:hypothetical protein